MRSTNAIFTGGHRFIRSTSNKLVNQSIYRLINRLTDQLVQQWSALLLLLKGKTFMNVNLYHSCF